jgi:hypothetical protein
MVNPHTTYGNVTITPFTGILNNNTNTVYTIGAAGGGGSGGYYQSSGTGATWMNGAGSPYVTVGATTNAALKVSGDADIQGNLKVKGVDITDMLAKIQDRLAILVPDPARLEKFQALKQAYEEYKLLEALCVDENKPSE